MKIFLSLSLFFLSIVLQAQVSFKDLNLEFGPHSVGFHYEQHIDSSRAYQRLYDWNNASTYRPIPISLWYPAEANQQKPLSILEYMKILKLEEEWENLPDELILNWFEFPNTPQNQRHLKDDTKALKNATIKPGQYPVVLYAPSYQAASTENFALCEYLASHGFLVISSPSRGTTNRFFEGGTTKDAETQSRDLEFLLNKVLQMPEADPSRIAVMGFSYGGLSNVLTQMRNPIIKANISLDGSVRYNYAALSGSPFFSMEKANVPFMHLAQKEIPEEVMKADKLDPKLNTEFRFYDELTLAEAYSFKVNDLSHSHFSTFGVLFRNRDPRQDKSDAAIMTSYRWVCRYALNFLNAYLNADPVALEFMEQSPEANGVAKGLISKRSKQAQESPFSLQDFNELAANQKYKELDALYQMVLEQHPNFKPIEWQLNNLGLQLSYKPGFTQQGLAVLEFATRLYPESANLFDSLGEACYFAGEKEKAIASFEKSLALWSGNSNAINRLKKLRE